MKRVLALVGLLAVGLLLLLEPDSGAVAVIEAAVQTTVVAPTSTTAPPDPTSEDPTTTPGSTTQASTTTSQATTTTTNATATDTGVFVGQAVNSRFGNFQVEITVEGGAITEIVTLDEPDDRRSLRINETAIPIYTEQALELQSADFDVISGATVTWQAWGASLASAIDMAGLS